MSWVLIVILNASTSYASTIAMQEFGTQDRCERAAKVIQSHQRYAIVECVLR